MKIITWNCNMGFRKKAHAILQYHPDILIIQECEHPDKLKFNAGIPVPTDIQWLGSNPNKGLAVFSYGDYKLKRLRNHCPDYQWVLPLSVRSKTQDFNLYGIWANNPHDKDGQYVEQVWKAVNHYGKQLVTKQAVLAGDFNSNTIWDKEHAVGSHSQVVKFLERKKIYSAYHLYHHQDQGSEQHPTFYLYRHADKPYHLDYCFLSKPMAEKILSVEIGAFFDWSPYSDHAPVSTVIDIFEETLKV